MDRGGRNAQGADTGEAGNSILMGEYHGILVNLSQKDRSIFQKLNVMGCKKIFFGLIALYKIRVAPEDIDALTQRIQANLADHVLFLHMEFYCHFYRGDELIIVFRQKLFRANTAPESWSRAITYGKSIGIPVRQLDFFPCRFQDESY
jgi:hypothetical protein